MRRFLKGSILTAVVGLGAMLVACQQQPSEPQAPADTRAADEAALRDLDAQWSKATGTNSAEQFVSYFADDASLLPPNVATLTGKEAIQKWATELMAMPGMAVSWQPTKAEASRGGDLGFTLGTYEMTLNDAKGKPMKDHGKYLTVWKKQADGSWKVAVDTFNSDLPAPGTTSH